MKSNLKTIIGFVLITSLLWAGDQATIGVVESGKYLAEKEKQTVKTAAWAYENWKNPVAVVPDFKINYRI